MNCCTYECNEGRDCPVRQSTEDGGVQVNGSLSFPLHRQVMPPESDAGDSAYWWAYGIAGAIFIAFVVMTWVVYPNFPQ